MTVPGNMNLSTIGTAIAIVVVFVSGGIAYGTVESKAERNAQDIRELQAQSRRNAEILSQINERTARMEATLEVILPSSVVRDIAGRRHGDDR